MRDRWDGNRGACDSWHDGDVEAVGWRARGQSGVVKQSQSVGVYKETTPQVEKSHVRWVPCAVAQGAAKEANHTEWGTRQHSKTWHEPHSARVTGLKNEKKKKDSKLTPGYLPHPPFANTES